MANICNNTFYAISENEENINYIHDFFENSDYIYDLGFKEYNEIEIYFESKWTFPGDFMQDLINNIPYKEDIYMRCLSVEYGCEYVAFNKWEGDTDHWIHVL